MTTIKQFFASDTWHKFRDLKLPRERVVGGICLALGSVTPLSAWMWRVLFLTAALGGLGLVVYIVLWICVPNE